MSKDFNPIGEQHLASIKKKMLKLQQPLIDLFFQERSDMKSLMKTLISDSENCDEIDLILAATIREMDDLYVDSKSKKPIKSFSRMTIAEKKEDLLRLARSGAPRPKAGSIRDRYLIAFTTKPENQSKK